MQFNAYQHFKALCSIWNHTCVLFFFLIFDFRAAIYFFKKNYLRTSSSDLYIT